MATAAASTATDATSAAMTRPERAAATSRPRAPRAAATKSVQAGEARLRLLGERTGEDVVEPGGEPDASLGGGRHGLLEVCEQRPYARSGAIRNGAREALEEQARQPVLVGTRVDRVAADLLRRDVVDGPHELPVRRPAIRRAPGQAEVREVCMLAAVGVVEQDVARLDVSMHEATAVGGVERVGDLRGDRDRAPGSRAPSRRSSALRSIPAT